LYTGAVLPITGRRVSPSERNTEKERGRSENHIEQSSPPDTEESSSLLVSSPDVSEYVDESLGGDKLVWQTVHLFCDCSWEQSAKQLADKRQKLKYITLLLLCKGGLESIRSLNGLYVKRHLQARRSLPSRSRHCSGEFVWAYTIW